MNICHGFPLELLLSTGPQKRPSSGLQAFWDCMGFTCRQVGQIGDSKLAQLETNEMNGKGFESNKDPQHSL